MGSEMCIRDRIQIVPMERQAMVLFSWEKGDVAAYYDPVLDCFSGFSLQR